MNQKALENIMLETGPDYSWLFSSRVLRWKSWFYEGLIPKLARDYGPVGAGLRLESISSVLNRYWMPRRSEIQKAVRSVTSTVDTQWNHKEVENGLARQLLRYLARDFVLHGATHDQLNKAFTVTGFEHIEQARDRGRGLILLGSHLGGHVAGVHWLIRQGIDLRMLVQRPKHVSPYLNQWFDLDHRVCTQNELFLRRGLSATDAAKRMTDARRLIQNGVAVYLNCDIAWTGPNTNVYKILGQEVRFQSIWADLAMILQCPVIQVSCRQIKSGEFHLNFSEPLTCGRTTNRDALFLEAMNRLEREIMEYPDDAIAHLLWPQFRPTRSSA